MRVLIAGCGDIGGLLAGLLIDQGHKVYGLKRDASSLPDGVNAVQADLTDPSSLTGLPAGIDRLVFMPTPGKRDQAAYEAVFLLGWKNLWSALRLKPERTIMVSSTAVYGQDDGQLVDENTIPQPSRYNGRALLAMEQLGYSCSSNLLVARLSGIYGPGREGLVRRAATDGLEIQQTPSYFTNRIHRTDAASALLHLLFMQAPQALYLVSDTRPASKYEVYDWVAQRLGRPAPGAITDHQAGKGKRVDNQRLCNSGFRFQYPDYQTGYGSIIEQRNDHEFPE